MYRIFPFTPRRVQCIYIHVLALNLEVMGFHLTQKSLSVFNLTELMFQRTNH